MTNINIEQIYINIMEIWQNYKKYKEYIPEYKQWSAQQDLQQAKREEYLKQHPDKVNQEDIRRGQILLHAIDVMDEYSQSNAEDMEVATEMASGQVVSLAQLAGMGLGTAALAMPKVKNWLNNFSVKNPKLGMLTMMLPTFIGLIVGSVAAFPAIIWATKMQVGASRAGRFEAMRKDLKNPAVFALLNHEQLAKTKELAKDIELEDKDKQRLEKMKSLNMNPLEPLKTLKNFVTGRKEYEAQRKAFNEELNENEKLFNTSLSEEQIQKAKRDQQLLAKLVNKIDIASQDYAENVELATNTLTTLGFAGGAATGWIANKLLKLCKVNPMTKFAKVFPWAVGILVTGSAAIFAAKVQKQASRIGRFKVRQEFLNNPNSLVYVDDEKAAEIKDVKIPEKPKKPGFFKFLAQVWKDYKEYTNYRKTTGAENLKFQKAIEKIDLSEEQLQEAKTLQMNTFKTFNKVDDKSQEYSESVEAVGEVAKQGIAFISGLTSMGVMLWQTMRMLNGKVSKNNALISIIGSTLAVTAVPVLAIVGLDAYVTKEQKKASRVANMLALKDLEDYRHYADFSTPVKNNEQKSEQAKLQDVKQSSNLLSRFK